jgi:hypothetical protein
VADSTDSRVINRLAVPIVQVKIHAFIHRIRDVEQQLMALPMAGLRTTDGVDVGRTVVNACLDLEQIRREMNEQVAS